MNAVEGAKGLLVENFVPRWGRSAMLEQTGARRAFIRSTSLA